MDRLWVENDVEFDALVAILEDRIEECHLVTCEDELDSETRDDATEDLRMARKFLRRLVPDHAIFDEKIEVGTPFDWEEFWNRDAAKDGDGVVLDGDSLAQRIADQMEGEASARPSESDTEG